MSRTLNEKQCDFADAIASLIAHINARGRHRARLAWGYRPLECATHLKFRYSLHNAFLAQDVDLFEVRPDGSLGAYVADTEAHRPYGIFWETLDPDASWGGHFNDGNHYSFRHEGRR